MSLVQTKEQFQFFNCEITIFEVTKQHRDETKYHNITKQTKKKKHLKETKPTQATGHKISD